MSVVPTPRRSPDCHAIAAIKIPKHRASQACRQCRVKKVKCDVVMTGVPCSKCQVYNSECVVTERRRKRFGMERLSRPSRTVEAILAVSEEVDEQHYSSVIDDFLASAPTSLDFNPHDYLQRLAGISKEDVFISEGPERRKGSISQLSTSNVSSTLQSSSGIPSPPSPTLAQALLPEYIRPPTIELGSDEIDFLHKKGALTVPEDRLRNQLLRSYVQYVHPFLPLVDLEDFLLPIANNDGTMRVSLLLYQAVMFAASAYIDFSFLREEGHEDRKAARRAFFQKVKLLYDFGYESDQISIVQALLLMTYWYEKPNDQKDAWYWMGTSLSFAHALGLHHASIEANENIKERRLRTRLWWSCFMRDRLIALSSRRPTRIKNEDFNVPMLVVDDFDVQPLPPKLRYLLGDCVATTDVAKRMTLARLCIEKVKLCFCIDHVLAVQYQVLGFNSLSSTSTLLLTPKEPAAAAARLPRFTECDQELNRWYEDLQPDCFFQISGRVYTDKCAEVFVHRAILGMIYSTTVSALHRPEVLLVLPSQSTARSLQQISRLKVKEAATEVIDVAQELSRRDLTRFLPPIGVTVLIPAVLVHLLDVKASDGTLGDISVQRFSKCMHILQQLRDIYPSADAATLFLEAAFLKANIRIPLEKNQKEVQQIANAVTHHETHGLSLPVLPESGSTSVPITEGTSAVAWEYPSRQADNNEINEDFNSMGNMDTWSDIFMAEDGLPFHFEMDWAIDFNGYIP